MEVEKYETNSLLKIIVTHNNSIVIRCKWKSYTTLKWQYWKYKISECKKSWQDYERINVKVLKYDKVWFS